MGAPLDDSQFAPPPVSRAPALSLAVDRRAERQAAAIRANTSPTAATPTIAAAPATTPRGPARWLVRLIGAGLFVLTLFLAIRAQHDIGIARDETVYMGAGDTYARWWTAFVTGKDGMASEKQITAHFGGPGATDHNREHPPLMKTLFGFSKKLLHDELSLTDRVTAHRAPTALFHALLVLVVFAWVVAAWGLPEAIIAALATLFLPRAFFHAGLATFDGPIATLWVVTLYAYWRALARAAWAPVAGIVWGLALATKHNALLIPFAIAPHFAFVVIRQEWPATRGPAAWRSLAALGRGLLRRWYVPLSLIVLGPLVLVAVWPWLWFDTYAHVEAWLKFHTNHVHYNFEYLGENWNHPPFPWHVAIVTTLFTVPAATLAAALTGTLVGARRAWRDRAVPDNAAGLLLFLSLAASMGPFFLGSTPIFGAEKHWEAAIPTLCVAAGLGAVWSARTLVAALAPLVPHARHPLAAPLAITLVGAALVGAAAVETAHAQPYALSHYNAFAGGAPGGADHGMNRQFWGYAARGVLPVLRPLAPPPGSPPLHVYSHDASPAWGVYHREGHLPRTLPDAGWEEAGIARSQFALVVHELHFNRHDYLIWNNYGTTQPTYVLRVDGVPIVSVYRRPPRDATVPRPVSP